MRGQLLAFIFSEEGDWAGYGTAGAGIFFWIKHNPLMCFNLALGQDLGLKQHLQCWLTVFTYRTACTATAKPVLWWAQSFGVDCHSGWTRKPSSATFRKAYTTVPFQRAMAEDEFFQQSWQWVYWSCLLYILTLVCSIVIYAFATWFLQGSPPRIPGDKAG